MKQSAFAITDSKHCFFCFKISLYFNLVHCMQTLCHLNQFYCLYQDDAIVAIHKPAGLLTHPTKLDRDETQFAVNLTEDSINQKVYPVHRLDKATSGILLFALSSTPARHLSKQFSTHQIDKHYLAICRGWIDDSGKIDHPLQYKNDPIAERDRKTKPPQTAITEYQCLAHSEVNHAMGSYPTQRYSLVKLTPKTGRKYQLRRHLNHTSHPIIGDAQYGDRHHNHFFDEWFGHHRLYLAATELHFTHPTTQSPMQLTATLETTFKTTLSTLNWRQKHPGLAISHCDPN